ncbi:MAG TPA: hypothetical protein VF265_10490 [Nevskiaceae bacterium]
MAKPRVRIFLDNEVEPVIDQELPSRVALDTRRWSDGPHRLTVRATGENGLEGVEEIPFNVRNGPGISVAGLRPRTTRKGVMHLKVDAFSTDDPFDPRRAEARSPIPTWTWVLFMFVLAWVVFYVATMWNPPPEFAQTPTYGSNPAAETYGTPSSQDHGQAPKADRGEPERGI